MTPRILVAEDDVKQARLIRIYLEREGHDVQVVTDGRTAIDRTRATRPDLVVLDVMMPFVDGLNVCRVLRMESRVPILLLTARTTEEDLLLGLDLGADDYMTKPYSPRELTARVRALLRRASAVPDAPTPVLRVGALEVDPDRYEVRISGEPIQVTGKEFAILQVLAQSPGRVFTRAQIIDRVFGFDEGVLERTVDAHVMNLRRKLEADGRFPRVVETVYGRGYRLAVPETEPGPGPGRDAGPEARPGAGGPGPAGRTDDLFAARPGDHPGQTYGQRGGQTGGQSGGGQSGGGAYHRPDSGYGHRRGPWGDGPWGDGFRARHHPDHGPGDFAP